VMDRVKEVLRLPAASVGPLPGLLARDQRIREVDSICRLDNGKRLVSVLSVERMFEHEALAEAIAINDENGATTHERGRGAVVGADDEEQMVVFKLGHEEYGVPISEVQEILRVAEQFTQVPKSASFIEGLVSLRGTVLPVVDLRRRFGLPSRERDERQRVMVFSVDGVRTGVIVDAVSEVLKVPASAFEGAPTLSEEQATVIRRVANLERQKRMILVLEAGKLFSADERDELGAVA
jgi:purine-binding chemotaxis protein CheW